MALPSLIVTNLSRAKCLKRRGFNAVLTLEDPACLQRHQLRFHKKPAPEHLILRFEDIDDDEYDYALATEDDVKAIIKFGRKHVEHNLLIHCFHGVGRSGGAALIILTDRLGNAEAALETLLAMRPEAIPNLRIVRLADTVMRTDGAMVTALNAWTARTPSVAEFRRQKRVFFEENRNLYAKAAAL